MNNRNTPKARIPVTAYVVVESGTLRLTEPTPDFSKAKADLYKLQAGDHPRLFLSLATTTAYVEV